MYLRESYKEILTGSLNGLLKAQVCLGLVVPRYIFKQLNIYVEDKSDYVPGTQHMKTELCQP